MSKRQDKPNAKCTLCKGKNQSNAKTDACSHLFCLTCLKKWAKVHLPAFRKRTVALNATKNSTRLSRSSAKPLPKAARRRPDRSPSNRRRTQNKENPWRRTSSR